ncbi:winged helix-turn-helix domain-containing protein [Halorubrum sp. RMP-47]|uniref:Winged helix-turn-helix domain-containing protein n=1 Tax=Halorubrum miltondacostae TaxID=3076378 RepID=A0ABD5M1W9_9EURY
MGDPGRKPTVSDEEILYVFQQSSDPVLTTSEVAEEIGIGRRGAFDRLRKLTEDGSLEMKKIGETGAVWWSPKALREQYSIK